ncbi:MAG: YkgJ family cysteine cluster protein [Treponema sp.]|nr:YkgJ family cysteine cluster protein [Treponema sp.]
MKNIPFYSEGLKFSCKRCSSCCRHDSGFVFISENDLENLISALKINKKNVIDTYCRWVTDWKGDEVLSLKEKFNKDCILWDNGCLVYKKRPAQCITFPFWESILSSSKAWETAASSCPGMNEGKLHNKIIIEENIELRSSQPIINKNREKSLNSRYTGRSL